MIVSIFDCYFELSDISRANFTAAELQGSYLHRVKAPKTIFRNAVLTDSDLSYSNFENSDFEFVSMHGSKLDHSNFSGSNFSRSDLHGVNLKFSNLSNSLLIGADLRNADLEGVNFEDADLAASIFTEADLDKADFSGANLGSVISGDVSGSPEALPEGWKLISGYLSIIFIYSFIIIDKN